MIWSLIGSIEGKVLDIVDNVVEDKDEANRLKILPQMESVNEPMKGPLYRLTPPITFKE